MKNLITLLLTTLALALPTLALAQTDDTPTTQDEALYCPRLVTTFAQGSSDRTTSGQVSELQRFIGSYFDLDDADIVVGTFGRVTRRYVQRFQAEQNFPANSRTGTVGSMTRTRISQMACGGSATTNTTNTSGTTGSSGTTGAAANTTSGATNGTGTTSCVYQSANAASPTQSPAMAGGTTKDQCQSACITTRDASFGKADAGDCKFTDREGKLHNTVVMPDNAPQGASCNIGGATVAHGDTFRMYLFDNGNPAGGTMNHDLCISSSIQATCQSGTTLGAALGNTDGFRFTRCFDDKASNDKVEYYLTNLYNTILGRQPDTSGFTYWKNQIRTRATTFDDIERAFRKAKAEGTDDTVKPTAHLTSTSVPTISAVLRGTAQNVSLQFTVYLTFSSTNPAERTRVVVKPAVTGTSWSAQVTETLKDGMYDYSLFDGNVMLENGKLSVSGQAAATPAAITNTSQTSQTQTTASLTPTQTAVRNAYLTHLKREPDAAGLTYWSREIDAGRFALGKLELQLQVTDLYETILGRNPDPEGLGYWVSQLQSGAITIDGVRQSFINCMAIPVGQSGSCRVSTLTPSSSAALANALSALQTLLSRMTTQ